MTRLGPCQTNIATPSIRPRILGPRVVFGVIALSLVTIPALESGAQMPGASASLPPLMIEIRNDLIRTQDGQASWAHRLAPLLREGARTL